MHKKVNRKLHLSKETLRVLSPAELQPAKGAGTTAYLTRSNRDL